MRLNPDPGELELALQLEQQAIALDDSLAAAHGMLASLYVRKASINGR